MNKSPDNSATDDRPWYRQFWPWFVFGLPASVVVAGVATVVIAVKHPHSLVVDDYYKKGLAINRQLAEDKVAQILKLRAELEVDVLVGEVFLSLDGATRGLPEQLQLQWIHPTVSDRDRTLTLKKRATGRYRGQLQSVPEGRWYVQLSGAAPEPWRLRSEIDLRDDHRFVL